MPLPDGSAAELFDWALQQLPGWSYQQFQDFLAGVEASANGEANDAGRARAIELLSLLMDRRYPTGSLRRSSLVSLVDASFERVMAAIQKQPGAGYVYHVYGASLPKAASSTQVLILDAQGFPPQGDDS